MQSLKQTIEKYFLLSALFFIGIISSLFFWHKITFPFKNPWNVVGPLTEIQYNPINDIVRFVVFIIFPVLLLTAVYFLNSKRVNGILFGSRKDSKDITAYHKDKFSLKRKRIFVVLCLLFSIIIALNLSAIHSSGRLDMFHEGESLGPAVSYMEGQAPYRNFLFVHGVYQDPLRSVLAFKLFGRSIGSVRTLQSIVKIIGIVLLSIFFIKIFNEDYILFFPPLTVLFLLLVTAPPGFDISKVKFLLYLKPREITTFSFLLVTLFLHNFIKANNYKIYSKRLFFILFLFSFIPLVSFGYSIDRGFFLFGCYLVLFPLLYLLFFHGSVLRKQFLITSFVGLISAFLVLGFLLRGAFLEFFQFVFLIMPRYKELLDGVVYPIEKLGFLIICLLIAANTFWVALKFIEEFHYNERQIKSSLRSFLEKYLIEFCLLILSVFIFRSALGRSDWEHVVSASSITFILSVIILFKHCLYPYCRYHSFYKFLKYFTGLTVVIISLFALYRIYDKSLIAENFPLYKRDALLIPENYQSAISFLKDNLNDKEYFFTMTSEAAWYYFLNKPCPTRFSTVWFAAPNFYQKEIIDDLKEKNVKFVLYRNNSMFNSIDGISNEQRLPLVVDFILDNYIYYKNIQDHEIWIKKTYGHHVSAEMYYKRGRILVSRKRYNEAISDFEKAVQINPDHEKAYIKLGLVYYGQGDFRKALFCFQKAIFINPSALEAYVNSGAVFFQMGNYEEALLYFKEALRINPRSAETHINLGIALLQTENFEEAIFYFKEALRLKPYNEKAKRYLQEALEIMRRRTNQIN
jgi:tetratricopeptide (TPR) repeat protein